MIQSMSLRELIEGFLRQSNVGVWFAKALTPNPLPEGEVVKTVPLLAFGCDACMSADRNQRISGNQIL